MDSTLVLVRYGMGSEWLRQAVSHKGEVVMNIENMKKVRDAVAAADEKTGTGFDMAHYFSSTFAKPGDCGTTACIAGHAAILAGDIRSLSPSVACEYLGLTRAESNHIFFGKWAPKDYTEISQEEAVEYLDACIDMERVLSLVEYQWYHWMLEQEIEKLISEVPQHV